MGPRTLIFIGLVFFLHSEIFSQDYFSYGGGNFSGLNQVIANPAAAADNRLKLDVILTGFDFTFNNSWVSIKRDALKYTGKITDWRDLGGKPAPIRAVGREETDASRQAISRDIKAFTTIKYSDGVKVVNLDPQMIELLDRYPTSLGFLNRSALNAAKTRVIPLLLDGVAPTPDNVENGRYPIVLEFGLAYKNAGLTEAGREFIAFVASPEGIRILRANGVVAPASRP